MARASGQRLTAVDMTYGPDVDVRLGPLELLPAYRPLLPCVNSPRTVATTLPAIAFGTAWHELEPACSSRSTSRVRPAARVT